MNNVEIVRYHQWLERVKWKELDSDEGRDGSTSSMARDSQVGGARQ